MRGPPARWIAPSTPPPPRRLLLAALTMASEARRVMSPTATRTRPARKSALVCCCNEVSTEPPKDTRGEGLRQAAFGGRQKAKVKRQKGGRVRRTPVSRGAARLPLLPFAFCLLPPRTV